MYKLVLSDTDSIDAKKYCNFEGQFYGKIEPSTKNKIYEILNYINFPSLKDSYMTGATDMPTAYLTIHYGSGQIKKIKDYGFQGTYGLGILYNQLEKISNDNSWHH